MIKTAGEILHITRKCSHPPSGLTIINMVLKNMDRMLEIMENQMENKNLKNGRQMVIETIMSLLVHCLRSCDNSG